MLAPYSKELRRLRSEDPTLESRIQAAFEEAKQDGHDRYAFVELKDGNTLVVETMNTNAPPSAFQAEDREEGRPRSSGFLRSLLAIFGF